MPELLQIFIGAAGAIFGAGVAWGLFQGSIKAARAEAAVALQQASEALARLNIERERSTKQDGKLDLYKERIEYLRRDCDELRAVTFRARGDSGGQIPAVRRPPLQREEPDSDPPIPPSRQRLPSRRDGE